MDFTLTIPAESLKLTARTSGTTFLSINLTKMALTPVSLSKAKA
jgi:hypothetical protein